MVNEKDIINAIINKTQNNLITWKRIERFSYQDNKFLYSMFSERDMAMDTANTYVGEFGSGKIYLTNQKYDCYLLLLIQPSENADLTPIGKGSQELLQDLEAEIRNRIDSPQEFIDALIN